MVDLVVLTLDTGVGRINLLLQVILGVLKASCLVNDVLDGRASGLKGQHQLVLLSRELGVDISDGGALRYGLVDVRLSNGLK